MAVDEIHVAGFASCTFFQKASNAAAAMQHMFPDKIKASIHQFETRDEYKNWLATHREASFLPLFTQTLGPKAEKHTSSPFSWLNGDKFIGGCDDTLAYLKNTLFSPAVENINTIAKHMEEPVMNESEPYDYDLIVIGGGSGGLACSKEAAKYGAKVAVLDYVKPSPQGTSWGLGGTCVNVGCIPKKLMHQSAIIGKILDKDAAAFGWKLESKQHDWSTMVQSVQDYIHSLNFKYRVDLRDKKVKYENLLGKFIDPHTLECVNPKKNKPPKKLRAKRFVVATGGRPKQLSCPGAELAISSDDIFQLDHAPGNTLVIGASYVALECAGFLRSMGFPVTVMVRSILLRGFDQDMAERIGKYMETEEQTVFCRKCVPTKLEKMPNGKIRVSWKGEETDGVAEFDTVLNATGREADLKSLGLETAGVEIDEKSGKLVTKNEQTNVPHIYAIGDVLKDKPELTPVAIQAGRLLSRRLYDNATDAMDYAKICTAVFTPIEYGTCGLSEEDSIAIFGQESIEVYHQNFTPLEWSLSASRQADSAYVKVIVDKTKKDLVVGFHYLGPNAGEITQAVGLAMKLNATFDDFVNTVGIHPTTAEVFTTLEITKSSGKDASAGGC